jgi:hypothetical protein
MSKGENGMFRSITLSACVLATAIPVAAVEFEIDSTHSSVGVKVEAEAGS